MLISMATSSGDDLPRQIEFLYSRNRLNVAISRARCLAVIVASPRLPVRPSRASARPWPSSDFYMMLLPLPLIAIGPKPRSLRSSRVAQLIDLPIHATIRQRRNKRLTAHIQTEKSVAVVSLSTSQVDSTELGRGPV